MNDIRNKYYHKANNCNGAIVMNCNPFTYGHLYLIEYAAKRVDYLYIFVVEEDKSYFNFKERFQMVVEGVKHIRNVVVLPSGRFIISAETFPEYFEKVKKKECTINVDTELKYFGKWIAPTLEIKKRFVGSEPKDRITKQYNEAMSQSLLHYEIEFIEIPRKRLLKRAFKKDVNASIINLLVL